MVAPPPTIPVFPAGYQPEQADFTGWWYDNALFFQNKVVFRARQAITGQSITTFSPADIKYDTIDEDPYGGWIPATFTWMPPVGMSGWYQVTITVLTSGPSAGTDIRLILAGTYVYDLATVQVPSHISGVEGQFTVYLIGGEDTVVAEAQLLNASGSVNTQVGAGVQSSMEIMWLGE